jgi:hypothetical protein
VPSSDRPPRVACGGNSSASGVSDISANTPLGPPTLSSKVGGRTDASFGCHGGEAPFGGQRFVRARLIRRGPYGSPSSGSFFAIALDLSPFFFCPTSPLILFESRLEGGGVNRQI